MARRLGIAWSAAVSALGIACGPDAAFRCADSAACGDGFCEPSGYCSFDDADCPSGRRYGALAGDGLAGTCTDVEAAGTSDSGEVGASTEAAGSASDTGSSGGDIPVGSSGQASTSGTGGDETTGPPPCGELGQSCCDAAQPCIDSVCINGTCGACELHVAANEYRTCGWRNDGVFACWGRDSDEQLGDGPGSGPSGEPQLVELSPAQVDPGALHSCAVDLDQSAWCWGSSIDGQIGQGGSGDTFDVPTVVPLGETVAQVAAGGFHSCALTENGGALFCWGANGSLQATGLPGVFDTPTEIVIPDVTQVAAGGFHTCAVTGAATIGCWGDNAFEQTGVTGDLTPQGVAPVATINDALAVTLGDYHTCALLDSGAVVCFGRNDKSQLGRPAGPPDGNPTLVAGLPDASAIVAGDDHTCAITDAGEVYCFGWNADGQVDGIAGGPDVPMPMLSPSEKATAVAAGRAHTCVVTDEAPPRIQCWGQNVQGQLGIGSTDPVMGVATAVFDCGWSAGSRD